LIPSSSSLMRQVHSFSSCEVYITLKYPQRLSQSFSSASVPKRRLRPLNSPMSIPKTKQAVPAVEKQYTTAGVEKAKSAPDARPSASILLISPTNEILLLHRVRTSSSFPSAHVFPGGNLASSQDGAIPSLTHPQRHEDGPAYRIGAIRECFEESGLLLAQRRGVDGGGLLEVSDAERDRARKEIHAGKLKFSDWVESLGGVVDSQGLIPFTRWVTPTTMPKRFTTQMYIYFLPISQASLSGSALSLVSKKEAVIPIPTSDGGLEHTTALFAPLSTWLKQARQNEIILFPPQYYLMHLLAPFLKGGNESTLQEQRDQVISFLNSENDGSGVKWADKVISPIFLAKRKADGRSVLGLDKPGPELENSGRGGDKDRVVLVGFSKDGPRNVEVRSRKEVLEEERSLGEEKL